MQVNLTVPAAGELIAEAKSTLNVAQSIIIDSPEMYVAAARELQEIKGRAKALDERRKTITKPIDEAKKAVMDLFRSPLAILEEAETLLKKSILTWDSEQEKKRKQEETRLREEARKERERLETEARKIEEAARKKAEELKRKAQDEYAAGNSDKASTLANKAAILIQNAEEKTTALQQQAEIVQAPTVVRDQPKSDCISMRSRWLVRIVNAKIIPRDYLIPDTQLLNKIATATKGSIKIDGVEIYEEPYVATRAAKY